ncbi:metallophosphoesterase [Metabacillus idriensis]|uniref:metallophosphoesterase n=1 Tax=Metabacillus idriensis TaxID=324768 RepID=UPI00203C0A2A|nr:metallophosphoesterase [Metabacillus idriensis]MCM3598544.1 metallophosphoesterase [Metabacillus idriensis]
MRKTWFAAVVLLICLTASPAYAKFSFEEGDATIVWLSDTQYYAKTYPEIMIKQIQWIIENRDKYNIRYVFHTGDLVDQPNDDVQWERTDQILKMLDMTRIPYGVLAGNHDLVHTEQPYKVFTDHFGYHRFIRQPFYGGSFENNRGHYDLLTIHNQPYIMIYMGWDVNRSGLRWMNKVLKEYRHHTAILTFHDYLNYKDERSPVGEMLYNKVVLKNPNVKMVLSGHYYGTGFLESRISEDQRVFQMLANYQAEKHGGNGFMRLLFFKENLTEIQVDTYSPYLNKFRSKKHLPKERFLLKLKE